MWAKNKQTGFTIVELLIVIVVIAVLAAVSVTAYSNVQKRARDSTREQDMASIKKALLLYQADNGGVRSTPAYSSAGPGGWDSSVLPNWLAFLRPLYGEMPKDPTNTSTGDPTFTDDFVYFYYCYPAGSGPMPATPNVRLGYRSEQTNLLVNTNIAVERCF